MDLFNRDVLVYSRDLIDQHSSSLESIWLQQSLPGEIAGGSGISFWR